MRSLVGPPSGLPRFTGSVVASLAWILDVDVDEIAVPPADHPEPWTVWRTWLGGRGLGLVPVRHPAAFGWPGPWLALLREHDERVDLAPRQAVTSPVVAAVAFGVPGGLVWHPLDGPETLADVEAGFVVAAADLAAWSPPAPGRDVRGRVEALALAPEAEAAMVRVEHAVARAGRGLDGDRYGAGRGTFSSPHARGIDLTLVEAEALEGLTPPLAAPDARRNVVTRGVDLDALIGRRFSIGEVVCLGRRRCEPCAHLQRLTGPGVLRGLVHRGGLRADILDGGTIRVGDAIGPLPDEELAQPPARTAS